jgi:DNA-binding HxlR family transcriptional regulator
LIVRDMMFRGYSRFQEFLGADEGISTNILADRFSRLEAQQIITRRKDPEDGRQVLYALTDKGRDLLPVMLAIFVWAGKHDPETRVSAELADQIRTDLCAVQDEMLTAIKLAI